MEEQRKFTRIKFDANAFISAGGERWQVELLDISIRGALLQSPYRDTLSEGTVVSLSINLCGEEEDIELHGKVAHIHDDYIGIVSKHMDVDSISLLRRIVELNVGDSELLEREMRALVMNFCKGEELIGAHN